MQRGDQRVASMQQRPTRARDRRGVTPRHAHLDTLEADGSVCLVLPRPGGLAGLPGTIVQSTTVSKPNHF